MRLRVGAHSQVAATLGAHAESFEDSLAVLEAGPGARPQDVDAAIAAHAASGALLTVAIRRRGADDPADAVIVADDGRVMAVQPSPHPDEALSEWADAGLYIASPTAAGIVAAGDASEGEQRLIEMLLAWDAPVHAYRLED